jgi:hypothetical protein
LRFDAAVVGYHQGTRGLEGGDMTTFDEPPDDESTPTLGEDEDRNVMAEEHESPRRSDHDADEADGFDLDPEI